MKIALIGNQNSGKTTLFNELTGMNAKIGNWPGVTIEKKSGIIKGTTHEIIDLPGIYSLSPYSVEEEVSRKFIFDENPDVIINIVDSTSLERSLYLTTQVLELNTKVIVALNMVDLLEKKGIIIDVKKLENMLGVKVVKISALKGTGVQELIDELNKLDITKHIGIFDTNIERTIKDLEFYLNDNIKHKRFVAVKLLEDDERFKAYKNDKIVRAIKQLEKGYNTDLEEKIAIQRYNYIDDLKEKTIKRKLMRESLSDRLDKIFLNKWVAFPIFAVIM